MIKNTSWNVKTPSCHLKTQSFNLYNITPSRPIKFLTTCHDILFSMDNWDFSKIRGMRLSQIVYIFLAHFFVPSAIAKFGTFFLFEVLSQNQIFNFVSPYPLYITLVPNIFNNQTMINLLNKVTATASRDARTMKLRRRNTYLFWIDN